MFERKGKVRSSDLVRATDPLVQRAPTTIAFSKHQIYSSTAFFDHKIPQSVLKVALMKEKTQVSSVDSEPLQKMLLEL